MNVSQVALLKVNLFCDYLFLSGSVWIFGSWGDLPVGVLVNDDSSVE
jgi:hypothetical protein